MNQRLRIAVLQRDGYACVYCGRRPPEVVLEADHVLAAAHGGLDLSTNLVAACRDCNNGKSDGSLPPPRHPDPVGLISRYETMLRTSAGPPGLFRWAADRCTCGRHVLPVSWVDGDSPNPVLGYRCPCGHQWLAAWHPRQYVIHAQTIRWAARSNPQWLQ